MVPDESAEQPIMDISNIDLSSEATIKVPFNETMTQATPRNIPFENTTQEGIIDYGFGKYKVFLPEDEDKAKQVW